MSKWRTKFLEWVRSRDGEPNRYALYEQFLHEQREDSWIWQDIAAQAGALSPTKQSLVHYLLMAATQYVACSNTRCCLARYFPSSPAYEPESSLRSAAKDFATFYELERTNLWEIVQARDVQINKLGRLSLFAPMIAAVQSECESAPRFVEIGSSIGFGLLWPFFDYRYAPDLGSISAKPKSLGELGCEVRNCPADLQPLFSIVLNAPHEICGVEISPISIDNPADVQWLRCLTAPGDESGRRSLELGLSAVRTIRPTIHAGCALKVLPQLVSSWKDDRPVVVYHSMTMHHLREQGKLEPFADLLADMSDRRRVFELSVEWEEAPELKQSADAKKAWRRVEFSAVEWQHAVRSVLFNGETDRSADGRILEFASHSRGAIVPAGDARAALAKSSRNFC